MAGKGQEEILLEELLRKEPNVTETYAVSVSQRRLWFLERLAPDTAAYNLPVGLRIKGRLDQPTLEHTLQKIVDRHDTLRTSFKLEQGELLQAVAPSYALKVSVIDINHLPEADREIEAYKLARNEVRTAFDLAKHSLFRATLIRLALEDHILICSMHHIVSDGWSLGLFVNELIAIYEALSRGVTPTLPELPVQYGDYAEWQREWLAKDSLDSQMSYWKAKLADAPPLLDLPMDRPRPPEQSFDGATLGVTLSTELIENLKTLAQKQNATLFMVTLAAFQVLISRYSGAEDILVGVPVTGRNRVELEGLIGFFANTLVLRSDLAGNPRFSDVLAQVRDVALDAFSNPDVPFEKLVGELNPPRSLSHNPIFQVMFSLVRAPIQSQQFHILNLSPYIVSSETSLFDLTMNVIEGLDNHYVQIEYNTTLFDYARIHRMVRHYVSLLHAITVDPEVRIWDLSLLTFEECQQIDAWNNTIRRHSDVCLPEILRDQAERTPESPAVRFEGSELSYRELQRRSSAFAANLKTIGVKTGDVMALYVERSLEMVIALIGILKTGAAYLPIDPTYPAQRVSFMIEDSGATGLITQGSLVPSLGADSVRRLLIEELCGQATSEVEAADGPLDPESMAYLIYTSGSTGKPKAVCIPHRALLNVLRFMAQEPGIEPSDRLLAVTPLSFDIAALELFLPLIIGGCAVLATRQTASDGERLARTLELEQITIMQATPATWRLLIEFGWRGKNRAFKILCGGEARTRDLADDLLDRSDSVWNLYGPTETTIWSSRWRVTKEGPIKIGRPVDNTMFYVLDPYGNRVPVGVPGELYIGGAGLATGYFRHAELTASHFLRDPFGPDSSSRIYRTGDKVRYLESGEIEYIGRFDFQVKVRGFRIELGEIEAALAGLPGVRDCVVTIHEDSANDKRIIAYVVLAYLVTEDRSESEISRLRALLKDRLPEYMLPLLVRVDRLPLTPNGKVDRGALPPPYGPISSNEAVVLPRNETEEKLARIWSKLLNVHPISVRASFFDMGGHSLLAIRVISEIASVFGARLPVSALFHEQTIEDVARQIQFARYGTSSRVYSTLIPLNAGGSRPPLFICGSNPRYVDIARALGPDQPVYKMDVYALQEDRLMAGQELYSDLPALAALFVNDIRAVQPEGPYFIAGSRDGGIVALQVASQLLSENSTLAVLLEWETPDAGFFRLAIRQKLMRYLRQAAKHLSTGELWMVIRGHLPASFRHHEPLVTSESPELTRRLYIGDQICGVIAQYSGKTLLHAPITYLRTRDEHDLTSRWRKVTTKGVHSQVVRGNVENYTTTYLPEFVATLKSVLLSSGKPYA